MFLVEEEWIILFVMLLFLRSVFVMFLYSVRFGYFFYRLGGGIILGFDLCVKRLFYSNVYETWFSFGFRYLIFLL